MSLEMPVKPRIGVVVPTLNIEATLEWTLCALRSQRDVSLEIMVVDSGSTDRTLEICKSWGVPTMYVPPGNVYHAYNAGLRQMSADWVTCLNPDDLVYPRSYARLIALGEERGASLVYGDCDFIDFEGRYLFTLTSPKPFRIPGLHQHGHIGFVTQAAIWRKSVFEDLGGFDEQYRVAGDLDFFFRMTCSGYSLAKVRLPTVAAFRRHSGQVSNREATAMTEELASIRNSGRLRRSPGSLLDLVVWHAQNSSNYLWRLKSRRTLPRYLRKMIGESAS